MPNYITDWKKHPDELDKLNDLKETREARTFTPNGVVGINIAKAYQRKILQDDEQLIIIIFGQPGSGKSTLTLWIEYFLFGEVNFDTTCFTHKEWANQSTSGKGKVIKYEEGRQTFVKRRAMGSQNKDGLDILNIFRALNHVHFINFQNISDVEDDLLFYHADGILWTHKVNGKKGYVSGYSPRTLRREKVKRKINDGVLEPGQEADFSTTFPDFKEKHPEEWQEYNKRKEKNLKEIRDKYVDS